MEENFPDLGRAPWGKVAIGHGCQVSQTGGVGGTGRGVSTQRAGGRVGEGDTGVSVKTKLQSCR